MPLDPLLEVALLLKLPLPAAFVLLQQQLMRLHLVSLRLPVQGLGVMAVVGIRRSRIGCDGLLGLLLCVVREGRFRKVGTARVWWWDIVVVLVVVVLAVKRYNGMGRKRSRILPCLFPTVEPEQEPSYESNRDYGDDGNAVAFKGAGLLRIRL